MKIMQCGSQNIEIDKYAMSVRINPAIKERMRLLGINLIDNTELVTSLDTPMPGGPGTKRDIKKNTGHVLDLPRVVFFNRRNIVELDGKQYCILGTKEPTKRDYPQGVLWLLDLEDGSIVKNDLLPYADRLTSIGREMSREATDLVNSKLRTWNEKLDRLHYSENPTTWALQIKSAEDTVDRRLDTIRAMIAAEEAKEVETNWDEKINIFDEAKDDLQNQLTTGQISSEVDLIDTLVYLYVNGRRDFVESQLVSAEGENSQGSISSDIARKVRDILRIRGTKMEEARLKVQRDIEEKSRRVEELLGPQAKQPTYAPFSLVDLRDAPPAPDKYFSPETMRQQIQEKISGLNSDLNLLTRVKDAFSGLREFIGGLESGARADRILSETERGAEIIASVREFLARSKEFLAKYATEIFKEKKDENGQPTGDMELNPRLMGYTNGVGNGEVAVHLNQVYAMLSNAVNRYRPEASTPQQETAA